MILYLVADAHGNIGLFKNYPHRFYDYWVSDSVYDPYISILDESILKNFGIEKPTFKSEPNPVSITLKNWP